MKRTLRGRPKRPLACSFPKAACVALRDSQLRRNLSKATSTIRAKREGVVGEVPDWQELRESGRAIKDAALVALDRHLSVARGRRRRCRRRCPLGATTALKGARSWRTSHGRTVWTRW